MSGLDDLNRRFEYRGDTSKLDKWSILKGDGVLYGDCEDYSLTLIWMMEGKSMVRFWLAICMCKYRLWHCASPRGVGHAVLFHDGKWIDNIQRRWMTAPPKTLGYKMRFWMFPPIVLIKMLISPVIK